MILFETERLYARGISPQDAPVLLRLRQDPDVQQSGVCIGEAPSEDTLALIRKADHAWLGILSLGDMNRYEGYLELEYALLREYRGMGYAAEAVRGLLSYAFFVRQAKVIAAWVRSGNERSLRLLEKSGFTLEGRLRRHARDGRDTLCYSILREEWTDK